MYTPTSVSGLSFMISFYATCPIPQPSCRARIWFDRDTGSDYLSFGSANIPSTSSLLRASSKAQVCILSIISITPHTSFIPIHDPNLYIPTSNPVAFHPPSCLLPWMRMANSRCIWLESISHNPQRQAPKESIHPDVLPALLLRLIARLHTKQPSRWRVIVVLVRMVCCPRCLGCAECPDGLCVWGRGGSRDRGGGAQRDSSWDRHFVCVVCGCPRVGLGGRL